MTNAVEYPRSVYYRFFKRALDLIVSILLLPILIVPFILFAILIKLDDGGPVIYLSTRLDRDCKTYKMVKLRTMIVNAPDIRLPDGSTYNAKDDERLTRIGRFLRETSLDEIPQILNVIMGKMSLIGPRPDIDINVRHLNRMYYSFSVRPGITGYSQAYFRNETSWEEKIENDLYYINNLSFQLDFRIFLRTIYTVLKKDKTYRKQST